MIKSYCKINIFLRVIRKLNNGLHNIQANNMLLELHDIISIKPVIKKDEILFKGKFSKDIHKKRNSIVETLDILRQFNLINEKKNTK